MMITRAAIAAVLVLSILVAARAAEAQQATKVARVGLLSSFSPSNTAGWHEAFRQGLREFGWIEGKNITIEYRYADGRNDRLPGLAAELVRLNVDVIVTSVTPDALAAKQATRTIPIVMAASGDPVATGIGENLARPGGNITGLSQMNTELIGKRLELLKEIVPRLALVAVLWNPDDRISAFSRKEIELPARKLGIHVQSLEVRVANELAHAFDEATRARAGALVIMPNPVFVTNLKRIADLAAKHNLPSIFHVRQFVTPADLLSMGPTVRTCSGARPATSTRS